MTLEFPIKVKEMTRQETKDYHWNKLFEKLQKPKKEDSSPVENQLAELKEKLINDNNGNGEEKKEIHLDKKQDHFEIIVKTV